MKATERAPLRCDMPAWVRRLVRTPREHVFMGEISRSALRLPAVATHRYWSGSPADSKTKRFHIARANSAISVWVDRRCDDHTPVFDHVEVKTWCGQVLRFPVDVDITELTLCPACERNAPEETS